MVAGQSVIPSLTYPNINLNPNPNPIKLTAFTAPPVPIYLPIYAPMYKPVPIYPSMYRGCRMTSRLFPVELSLPITLTLLNNCFYCPPPYLSIYQSMHCGCRTKNRLFPVEPSLPVCPYSARYGDKTRLDKSRQIKTNQHKTRRINTKQDKTTQNKTKQTLIIFNQILPYITLPLY